MILLSYCLVSDPISSDKCKEGRTVYLLNARPGKIRLKKTIGVWKHGAQFAFCPNDYQNRQRNIFKSSTHVLLWHCSIVLTVFAQHSTNKILLEEKYWLNKIAALLYAAIHSNYKIGNGIYGTCAIYR